MKLLKRRSYILIGAIIVCLGGLVRLQTHMLRNAFIQSEINYDKNIQIALHQVSQELLASKKKNLVAEDIESSLKDSLHVFTLDINRKVKSNINIHDHREINTVYEQKIIIETDDSSDHHSFIIDSIQNKEWVTEYVQNIIKNQELELNTDFLDSFDFGTSIRKQLDKLGITDTFEFAITQGNDSILRKTENYNAAQKVYTKPLFLNNIYANSGSLQVTIPQRRLSILAKILLPLILSIVFLITASLLFYYIFGLYRKQKKVSEARDDFINSMSHELKTPLATIALSVENIRSSPEDSGPYLKIINEENTRMLSYIENILQLAQLDNTSFVLNKKPIDLTDFCKELVESLKPKLDAKNVRLNLNTNGPALVHIDAMHFRNVVLNLIDNAIKYSQNDPEISIEVSQNESDTEFMIKDNGQGIAKEDLSKIFDKFYRVQKDNIYSVKGTGVGLSYVKLIVEAHGGVIDVTSKQNQGTTFKINLPK